MADEIAHRIDVVIPLEQLGSSFLYHDATGRWPHIDPSFSTVVPVSVPSSVPGIALIDPSD